MADMEKPGRKKVILTVVGVVAILIVAAGAGFALRMWQNKHKGNTSQQAGQPLPQTVDDAQNLRLQGDTAGADKKIDAALNDSKTSNDDKYLLYMQKAAGQADQKNYAGAADSYDKAAGLKQTSNVYDQLGDAYVQAGQKDKAIEAYKKAITLVTGPVADDDKAFLERKITNLGGSL